MNKFKHMNENEIKQYVQQLDAELRTCNFNRISEINAEIDAANQALFDGDYRNVNAGAENYRKGSSLNNREVNSMYFGSQLRSVGSYNYGSASVQSMPLNQEAYEQRGTKLKKREAVEYGIDEMPELRAIAIGNNNLIVNNYSAKTMNPTFNEVSSVIDVVNSVPLMGGESYNKGFIVESGEGDYTSETEDYTDIDPVTDFVNIGKAKITAYAEMTDESMKLSEISYQDMVRASIQTALRKKIAKQIIMGAGGSNSIVGIFKAPANVIPVDSDIIISEIDETTLDKIVFNYGGSENVEGGAYLILNKLDLAAFAAVRSTDGKKLYTIKLDDNGNTGKISSDMSYEIRFIINSACPALSAVGTANDTYCMAYGKPAAYEMPMFSPVTVEESRDFKFKSGQICFRGSVWVGGNVAAYKGFARVKKGVVT